MGFIRTNSFGWGLAGIFSGGHIALRCSTRPPIDFQADIKRQPGSNCRGGLLAWTNKYRKNITHHNLHMKLVHVAFTERVLCTLSLSFQHHKSCYKIGLF